MMTSGAERAMKLAGWVRRERESGRNAGDIHAAFVTILAGLNLTGLERQRAEQAASVPRAPVVNKPGRANRKRRRESARRWLAVYDVNRAFGGPEEGGWWYDYGVPAEGFESFYSLRAALVRRDEVQAALDRINHDAGPYGDLSSVLCRGALRAIVTREPPAPFPDRRPHYE